MRLHFKAQTQDEEDNRQEQEQQQDESRRSRRSGLRTLRQTVQKSSQKSSASSVVNSKVSNHVPGRSSSGVMWSRDCLGKGPKINNSELFGGDNNEEAGEGKEDTTSAQTYHNNTNGSKQQHLLTLDLDLIAFQGYQAMSMEEDSFSDSDPDSIQPSPVVLNQNSEALFSAATVKLAANKLRSGSDNKDKSKGESLNVPYSNKGIVKGPRDVSFDFTDKTLRASSIASPALPGAVSLSYSQDEINGQPPRRNEQRNWESQMNTTITSPSTTIQDDELTEIDVNTNPTEVTRSRSDRLRALLPGSGFGAGNYKPLTDENALWKKQDIVDVQETQGLVSDVSDSQKHENMPSSRYEHTAGFTSSHNNMTAASTSRNDSSSSSSTTSSTNYSMRDVGSHTARVSSDTSVSLASTTASAKSSNSHEKTVGSSNRSTMMKVPMKKSSTTFSKKLVFSKANEAAMFDSIELDDYYSDHNHSHNSSDKNNNDKTTEDEERDILLPLSHDSHSPPKRAPTYRARRRSIPLSGKVMTKSEFENYRKTIAVNDITSQPKVLVRGSGSGSGDHYDNDSINNDNESVSGSGFGSDSESELPNVNKRYDESVKESAKMRQKQDAHLSVYRQKMSKITGGSTMGGLPRPRSTIGLNNQLDNVDDSDSDDEYDNVPLGILKAHGFPTGTTNGKAKLTSSDSSSTFSGSGNRHSQGLRPSADTASLRSSKSAFNLPTNRTSPVMPSSSSAILPASLPPFLQNGSNPRLGRGLVGEIAREEEAKMMRKSLTSLDILAQAGNRPLASESAPSVYGMSMGAPSIYGMPSAGSRSMLTLNNAAGLSNNNGSESQIQTQLQQMMEIQMKMLEHIQHQQPTAPQFQPQYRPDAPPSRLATRPSMPVLSSRPMSNGMSVNSFSNIRVVNDTGPENRSLRGSKSQMFSRSNNLRRVSYNGQPQQPQSTGNGGLIQASEDEEDEDDDRAWESMLEKRRLLKESWAHKGTATVT